MPIKLDKNLCIGCGTCVAVCPKSFKMNDDEAKAEVISQEDSECVKNSVESCPVQAIKVE
ncbi:MAG: ferredoxin [Candidatus Falkowbacteria bacterium]